MLRAGGPEGSSGRLQQPPPSHLTPPATHPTRAQVLERKSPPRVLMDLQDGDCVQCIAVVSQNATPQRGASFDEGGGSGSDGSASFDDGGGSGSDTDQAS